MCGKGQDGQLGRGHSLSVNRMYETPRADGGLGELKGNRGIYAVPRHLWWDSPVHHAPPEVLSSFVSLEPAPIPHRRTAPDSPLRHHSPSSRVLDHGAQRLAPLPFGHNAADKPDHQHPREAGHRFHEDTWASAADIQASAVGSTAGVRFITLAIRPSPRTIHCDQSLGKRVDDRSHR